MKKYDFKSDLANESLKHALLNKDYKIKKYNEDNIEIEHFEILKTNDLYPFEIGEYIEISFLDLSNKQKLIQIIHQQIKTMIQSFHLKIDPTILIVGLGNQSLTCDALGPLCTSLLQATHHYPIALRHQKHLYDTIVFTPSVMGKTGIETSMIIKNIIDEEQVDLLITIDALCASDYNKLTRVIQMNNVGIYPGSGIGNHRKGLTLKTLGIPVMSIGIPTVIHVSSLMNHIYDLLEGYFKESLEPSSLLKVSKRLNYQGELNDKQKRMLLGEIGLLENRSRSQLFKEILDPLENNYILTPKQIDEDLHLLSTIISSAINELTL